MIKKITIFCTALLLFSGLIWLSKTSTNGKIVTVKEISNSQILVEDRIGNTINITIPKIISKLLVEEKEYRIQYKKHNWSKELKLTDIEPIIDK